MSNLPAQAVSGFTGNLFSRDRSFLRRLGKSVSEGRAPTKLGRGPAVRSAFSNCEFRRSCGLGTIKGEDRLADRGKLAFGEIGVDGQGQGLARRSFRARQ